MTFGAGVGGGGGGRAKSAEAGDAAVRTAAAESDEFKRYREVLHLSSSAPWREGDGLDDGAARRACISKGVSFFDVVEPVQSRLKFRFSFPVHNFCSDLVRC